MVWIHGGGFVVESGAEPRYDGTNLAAKGIVVVTVNRRLNALGFLAHPKLTEESPVRGSGNYGMLDLVAAPRWVTRNIRPFIAIDATPQARPETDRARQEFLADCSASSAALRVSG